MLTDSDDWFSTQAMLFSESSAVEASLQLTDKSTTLYNGNKRQEKTAIEFLSLVC